MKQATGHQAVVVENPLKWKYVSSFCRTSQAAWSAESTIRIGSCNHI